MGFSKLVSQFSVHLNLSRGEGCFMYYMSWAAHTETHLLWAADEAMAFSDKKEKMKL